MEGELFGIKNLFKFDPHSATETKRSSTTEIKLTAESKKYQIELYHGISKSIEPLNRDSQKSADFLNNLVKEYEEKSHPSERIKHADALSKLLVNKGVIDHDHASLIDAKRPTSEFAIKELTKVWCHDNAKISFRSQNSLDDMLDDYGVETVASNLSVSNSVCDEDFIDLVSESEGQDVLEEISSFYESEESVDACDSLSDISNKSILMESNLKQKFSGDKSSLEKSTYVHSVI